MKQFINSKESVVTEAINGLLRTSDNSLYRLDGYPHIKVVARNDWDKSGVALISGGGSGHEPSHAGFVGKGMLTAAVCGEVFASPSMEAVLAAILNVTGSSGCLLIVKNYTGDRLNFGLAAERARALGYLVEMIVVGDDVALPELPQPRGVAGTLFLHKIIGAMASHGTTLNEIVAQANRIAKNVSTIGMSLDTCTIPGFQREDRIAGDMAELGLGIHGEPGMEQVSYTTARDAMNLVIERLQPSLSEGPLVALLNNLGGCTSLEMGILTEALMNSKIGNKIQGMINPAPLMTSLDMRGFSVSLYSPSKSDLEALMYPVEPKAWSGYTEISPIEIKGLPSGLSPTQFKPSHDTKAHWLISTSCNLFLEIESDLNNLDAKSGDGDTGSTLATAARSLLDKLDTLPLADRTNLFRSISQELSESMGGSSGVLLAIFFAAAGDAAENGNSYQECLRSGLQRIQQVGGAQAGDRTLIDALEPAVSVLNKGLDKSAIAARKGADFTSKITKAKAGRASYIGEENLAGYNDPGAEAVARLLEKLASS